MSAPADLPAALTSSLGSTGTEVTTAVVGGAVVVFGIYALKPVWRTARSLINKLGF